MIEPLDFLRHHDAEDFKAFLARHDWDDQDKALLRRLVANAGLDDGRIRELFPTIR